MLVADLHGVPGLTPPLLSKVTPTGPRPKDSPLSQSSSLAGAELTPGDAPGPHELMIHSSRGLLASCGAVALGPENTSSPLTSKLQGLMSTEEAPGRQDAQPPDHSGLEGLARPEDGVCSPECTFRRQRRKPVGWVGAGWQH